MHGGRIPFKPWSTELNPFEYKGLEHSAPIEAGALVITVKGMMEFQQHLDYLFQYASISSRVLPVVSGTHLYIIIR